MLFVLSCQLVTSRHFSSEQSGWDRGKNIWRIWAWSHLIRKQTLCLQKTGGNFSLFLKWKMTHSWGKLTPLLPLKVQQNSTGSQYFVITTPIWTRGHLAWIWASRIFWCTLTGHQNKYSVMREKCNNSHHALFFLICYLFIPVVLLLLEKQGF